MAWGRASAKESYSAPPPQCQYWFLPSFGNSRLEWEEMEKCRYTAARLCLTVWSPSLVCGREMLAGHDLTHLTSSSVTLLQSHLKQPCSRGVEIAVCLSVVLDFLFFFFVRHQEALTGRDIFNSTSVLCTCEPPTCLPSLLWNWVTVQSY